MTPERRTLDDIWYSGKPISEEEAHYPVYCLHCWDAPPFPLYLLGQNPEWLKTHPKGPFGAFCPRCDAAGLDLDLYDAPWWLGDQSVENLESEMEAYQNRSQYSPEGLNRTRRRRTKL